MNKKLQAHSAIFFANTIFGLGVPVTKLLLDEWVTPMGYMASRSLGACILFWLIAAFMPKEHVERKDLITILLGGLLGFCLFLAHRNAHPCGGDALCRPFDWREDHPDEVTGCVAGYCRCSPNGTDEPVAWFWQERSDWYRSCSSQCAHLGRLSDHHPQCGIKVFAGNPDEVCVPDLRHRNGSNSVTRTLCQCPLHPVMGVGWRTSKPQRSRSTPISNPSLHRS